MTEQAKSTPKATGSAKPMGLLQAKWVLVGQALSTPRLSAGDCAVLWQLCERYNEQAGAAWPSMNRLASDISRDRKTVQRSLARLEAAELVQVTERGTRTRSNRYKPIFPKVGAQASEGGGVDAPQVGAQTPPESTHEPGHQAGVNGGVPSPADAGSGGGAGATLEATPVPPSGRQFPAFWSAYPKATGVFKAEQAIESILASGQATLPELVRGARAYAAWVQAQPWPDKAKYTKGPAKWLEGRHWLDDYAITKKQAQPDKQAATPKAGATPQTTARPVGQAGRVAEILARQREAGAQIRQAEQRKTPDYAVKKLKTSIRQIQAPSGGLSDALQEAFITELGQVLGSQVVRDWLDRRHLGQVQHPQPEATPQQIQELDAIVKEYARRSRAAVKASKGAAK